MTTLDMYNIAMYLLVGFCVTYWLYSCDEIRDEFWIAMSFLLWPITFIIIFLSILGVILRYIFNICDDIYDFCLNIYFKWKDKRKKKKSK